MKEHIDEIAVDPKKRIVYIKFLQSKKKEFFDYSKLGDFLELRGKLHEKYTKLSFKEKCPELKYKSFRPEKDDNIYWVFREEEVKNNDHDTNGCVNVNESWTTTTSQNLNFSNLNLHSSISSQQQQPDQQDSFSLFSSVSYRV